MGAFSLSGDNARLNNGEPGAVIDERGLEKLFVGDMTVPPLFLANGDKLRILEAPMEGVLASGDTGIQEIERRLECPTERAIFGNMP